MGFSPITAAGVSRSVSSSVANRITVPPGGTGLELTQATDAANAARFRLGDGYFEFGPGGTSSPDTVISRMPPVGAMTTGVLAQNGRPFDRLGWLNVEDFGAVGNGIVDDTSAIQAAFNVSWIAPTVVYFGPGTYVVNGAVFRPANNTIVMGAGMGVTIIKAANNLGNVTLFQNENGSTGENGNDNVVVRDMSFDANVAGRPTWNTGHVFSFNADDGHLCENITVQNVEVYNGQGAGMVLANCRNLVVEGCHVHDCERDGIAVYYNSSHVRVANNSIRDCGDDYIALNAELSGSTGHQMRDVTVTGNTCGPSLTLSANQGIVVRGAQRYTIVGNTVQHGDAAGIYVTAQNTTGVSNGVISNNVINASGEAGGTGYAIMIGSDDLGGGISSMLNCTISNNLCEGGRGHGIFLWTPDTGSTVGLLTIVGNVLRGRGATGGSATADGIQLAASSSTVVDRVVIAANEIDSWARYGINVVQNGTVRRCVINSNVVTSNGKQTAAPGIRLSAGHSYVVNGNICSDIPTATQTYGIEASGLTGSSVISSNLVSGNVTGGTNLSSNSLGTLVVNNQT